MEAVGGITHRWNMGAEARALVILTGVLLAFGLATVYSASLPRKLTPYPH